MPIPKERYEASSRRACIVLVHGYGIDGLPQTARPRSPILHVIRACHFLWRRKTRRKGPLEQVECLLLINP